MLLNLPTKIYASADCLYHGDKAIRYGYLSILSEDFDNVKAGYYISNEAGAPFAYPVKPETVNIIVSKSD